MKVKFVPQDVWIGLYWKTETEGGRWQKTGTYEVWEKRTYYLCLLPCLPIIWSRVRLLDG
jgi:hypothetical protein